MDTLRIVKVCGRDALVWRGEAKAQVFNLGVDCELVEIIGRRVRRGRDWRWGYQDHVNGKPGLGTCTSEAKGDDRPGWVSVVWDNGTENHYRFGAEGEYDIELATEDATSLAHRVLAFLRRPIWR